MSVAQTLLGLLESEPAHGYTLKRRYDQHFGRSKPLPFGQVYASLSRFERDGLARLVSIEVGEGPERRLLAITADGVTAVDTWMSTPEEPTGFAISTLFTKTALALLLGRPAAEVLDAQREVHMTRMRSLNRSRREASIAELLAITYELNHLDADLRWIEEAEGRLPGLSAELQTKGASR